MIAITVVCCLLSKNVITAICLLSSMTVAKVFGCYERYQGHLVGRFASMIAMTRHWLIGIIANDHSSLLVFMKAFKLVVCFLMVKVIALIGRLLSILTRKVVGCYQR